MRQRTIPLFLSFVALTACSAKNDVPGFDTQEPDMADDSGAMSEAGKGGAVAPSDDAGEDVSVKPPMAQPDSGKPAASQSDDAEAPEDAAADVASGGDQETGRLVGMTAAHKTLPLPSYARVTNLKNGKSIVVRINDRGPFVANRLIDLSYSAAARLDMLREGTTLVEVRALTPGVPDDLTRSAAAPAPTLYVQAGAFADEHNAQRLLRRLQAAGLPAVFVAAPLAGSAALYRVRVGPVGSVADFDRIAARLNALGVAQVHLAVE